MSTHKTITRTGLATLALTLAAAGVPSAASAAGGDRGDRAQDQVSSRVSTKLRSVSRGLDRAEGYVEDGDAAKAASSLTSVRRSLASAQKTTLRKVAADSDGASSLARAVERAEHAVVASTTSLYDGQTGDVVTALSTTLDAALDGRDALLAGVDALTDDQSADYDGYYAKVAKDVASESDDIADAVSDDELSSEATSALGDATTRLAAVKTAVDQVVAASGDSDTDGGTADGPNALAGVSGTADCGPGGGRRGGGQSGTAPSTGTTGTTGTTGATGATTTDTTTTSAARFGGGRR